MNYWLFKSEPHVYGIDQLAAEPGGTGRWDGIRNYQARNLLRDAVAAGDRVLFYHSSCPVPGVAGTARVARAAYPDPSQFDGASRYFDAKATPAHPRWFCVDLTFEEKFPRLVPLRALKSEPALADMVLLHQGRLSIQPVSAGEWAAILALAARGA